MTDHDYMTDWTEEERTLTKGMPPNVAVGFVARRRGTNVRDVHNRYSHIADGLTDLMKAAQGKDKVSESDLRGAFEKLSSEWPSRPKEES